MPQRTGIPVTISRHGAEFSITGIRELKAKMRAAPALAAQGAARGAYQAANEVMTVSKQEYCPWDTGALRATGIVMVPQREGSTITVVLGYGDAAVKYAVVVHETNKAYKHGKQWKYLETPLKASLARMGQVIGNAIKEALKDIQA